MAKRKKFPKRRRQKSTPEFSTNYEKYVHMMDGWRKEAYQQVSKELEVTKKNISRAKNALKQGVPNSLLRKNCQNIIDVGTMFVRQPIKTASRIEEPLVDSHLFLLGPATSESLFNFKPSDYQYIENGKLPFDNCYFELSEGIETKLPGLSLDAKIEGIQLSHNGLFDVRENLMRPGYGAKFTEEEILKEIEMRKDEKSCRNYDLTTFMNLGEYGPAVFWMELEVANQKEFEMASLYLPHFKERVGYVGPWSLEGALQKKDFSKKSENMNFNVVDAAHIEQPYIFSNSHRTINPQNELGEVNLKEASKFVGSLYCFGVNMINYVNSHNVTLEKKEGRASPNGENHNTHSKPYNLITLKDEVRSVPEESNESDRHLEYQIYVRGHPRRLRDSDGVIRKTTWVSPHVKGPEGAPWREQRYQVLAAKLQREKEFYNAIQKKE